MRKEDVSKFKVGQCGGCGLGMRFWAIGDATLTCPNCGMDHEVECGEMENLTTGEKSEVTLLVPVGKMESDGVIGKHGEQRN